MSQFRSGINTTRKLRSWKIAAATDLSLRGVQDPHYDSCDRLMLLFECACTDLCFCVPLLVLTHL